MIIDALKVMFLVNASVAVALGLFYQLVKLCLQLDVSPWFAALTYVVLYAWWWVRECRRAHG
jgi:hypothetical protein